MNEQREAVDDSVRGYRFAPRDRTGWLLGLQASQLAILTTGTVAAALIGQRLGLIVAVLAFATSAVLAFGVIRSEPIATMLAVAAGFASRRRTALASITGHSEAGRVKARLPGVISSARIGDREPLPWAGLHPVGVVNNRREKTLTAVLRVRGRGFALVERAEQERLLHQWGEALAGFCRERTPVVQVTWSEWATTTNTTVKPADAVDSDAGADYQAVINGTTVTAHDVLVAVTVASGKTAAATLAEQLRLLTLRLEDAGLSVDLPLSPRDLRCAVARRCDPTGATVGPLATRNEWRHVVVDGSVHAAMWVAEWPRSELPPNWLEPVLMAACGTRTFALLCRPVAPSASRRQLDRDATRLATDAEQRTRHGFRLPTTHRRIRDGVDQREAELVAGYAELTFVGLVTATAGDPEQLEVRIADLEQAAAQTGMVLARLDGRHDLALAATLPLGFNVQRGRR